MNCFQNMQNTISVREVKGDPPQFAIIFSQLQLLLQWKSITSKQELPPGASKPCQHIENQNEIDKLKTKSIKSKHNKSNPN